VVGANKARVIPVVLDVYVCEVIGLVAMLRLLGRVIAVAVVAADIVFHPGQLVALLEGNAGDAVFWMAWVRRIFERAIRLPCDASHTVEPGTGHAQLEPEDGLHLRFRVWR